MFTADRRPCRRGIRARSAFWEIATPWSLSVYRRFACAFGALRRVTAYPEVGAATRWGRGLAKFRPRAQGAATGMLLPTSTARENSYRYQVISFWSLFASIPAHAHQSLLSPPVRVRIPGEGEKDSGVNVKSVPG